MSSQFDVDDEDWYKPSILKLRDKIDAEREQEVRTAALNAQLAEIDRKEDTYSHFAPRYAAYRMFATGTVQKEWSVESVVHGEDHDKASKWMKWLWLALIVAAIVCAIILAIKFQIPQRIAAAARAAKLRREAAKAPAVNRGVAAKSGLEELLAEVA